jgi:hypothetical protein
VRLRRSRLLHPKRQPQSSSGAPGPPSAAGESSPRARGAAFAADLSTRRRWTAAQAGREHNRDAGAGACALESGSVCTGKNDLPRLRGDYAAAGALPSDYADRLARSCSLRYWQENTVRISR